MIDHAHAAAAEQLEDAIAAQAADLIGGLRRRQTGKGFVRRRSGENVVAGAGHRRLVTGQRVQLRQLPHQGGDFRRVCGGDGCTAQGSGQGIVGEKPRHGGGRLRVGFEITFDGLRLLAAQLAEEEPAEKLDVGHTLIGTHRTTPGARGLDAVWREYAPVGGNLLRIAQKKLPGRLD